MANPKTFNTQLSEEQLNTAFDNAINKVPELRAALDEKVDKQDGKGLSTNDYTDEEKAKLSGLENYDDTELKAEIAAAAEQAAINRGALDYQRKNLLKNTAESGINQGISYTVNADGSVTAIEGTSTNVSNLKVNTFICKAGVKYILSGTPESSPSGARISLLDDSGTETWFRDTGSGVTVSVDEDTEYRVRIRFCDPGGTINEPVTFYPMIRYAEITDDTYEPYKPSVEERLAALEAILGGGT